MRMKKACAVTGLTERAVRLYVKKGLASPQQRDGLLEFSKADIGRLREIARLREMDFSIEQIGNMVKRPDMIPAIIACRAQEAEQSGHRQCHMAKVLRGLSCKDMIDMGTLVEAIVRQSQPIHMTEFSRFDEDTSGVRPDECDGKAQRIWLMAAGALILAVLLAGAWLSMPRMHGFLSPGDMTAEAITAGMITVRFHDAETTALLGRECLTLPYRILGTPMTVGEPLPEGCQLMVRLTNLDLLHLGISPLINFHTHYEQVNDAWLQAIFCQMKEEDIIRCMELMVRIQGDIKPLRWWRK